MTNLLSAAAQTSDRESWRWLRGYALTPPASLDHGVPIQDCVRNDQDQLLELHRSHSRDRQRFPNGNSPISTATVQNRFARSPCAMPYAPPPDALDFTLTKRAAVNIRGDAAVTCSTKWEDLYVFPAGDELAAHLLAGTAVASAANQVTVWRRSRCHAICGPALRSINARSSLRASTSPGRGDATKTAVPGDPELLAADGRGSLMWFQGAIDFGPRAHGTWRSRTSDRVDLRDRLGI